MMDQSPITCELVDQHELDRRYVAGLLDEAEAAAFEAHYYGCDRCWALVKGGAGVRASLLSSGAIAVSRPRSWWKPLALAAGLGVILLGTWRVVSPPRAADPDAIRGRPDSIAVQTGLEAGRWTAVWPPLPDAVSYQARIFTGEGRVILTRELSDTSLTLPADSLATLGPGGPLYLEVQGFDLLRRPVGRSPLTSLRAVGAPR
jgi:hypothetical protein